MTLLPPRDLTLWTAWENEWIRAQPLDYWHNLAIFEALYEEAVALGVLPPDDPMEGLEEKIRLARDLNVPTIARPTSSGT